MTTRRLDAPHARMTDAPPGVVHKERGAPAPSPRALQGSTGKTPRAADTIAVRAGPRAQTRIGAPDNIESSSDTRPRRSERREECAGSESLAWPLSLGGDTQRAAHRLARGRRADNEAELGQTAGDTELEDERAADVASARAPERSVGCRTCGRAYRGRRSAEALLEDGCDARCIERWNKMLPLRQAYLSREERFLTANDIDSPVCLRRTLHHRRRVSAPFEPFDCAVLDRPAANFIASSAALIAASCASPAPVETTSTRTRQQRARTESHEEQVPALCETHEPVLMRSRFAPKSVHFSDEQPHYGDRSMDPYFVPPAVCARRHAQETRTGSVDMNDSQRPPHAARAGTPANPRGVVSVRLAVWCRAEERPPVVDCRVDGGAARSALPLRRCDAPCKASVRG
ncbi:hypothetical protein FB451DRAFT_1401450 [Mycena latifolia]|nr:hypothetical protein FB451DRAFT_1401450 [Mycena latifolia]